VATIPAIDPTYLTMLCDVICGADNLLNDSELKLLLKASEIGDVSPTVSRRQRLFNALVTQQDKEKNADSIATFLQKTMYHLQHTKGEKTFENCRQEINSVLAFAGYSMGVEGQLEKFDSNQVPSISSQIDERIEKLRTALQDRKVNADVLRVCRSDLLTDVNYYRVVQEATHILATKVRQKAGLTSDGPEIAEQAFAVGWQGVPILALNGLRSEAEMAEQYGLLCIFKGLLCLFQDERTRAYRPAWTITAQEALDILSLISFLNNKFDQAARTQS
jgi:uncharacterized protein (TIGR02391 family)